MKALVAHVGVCKPRYRHKTEQCIVLGTRGCHHMLILLKEQQKKHVFVDVWPPLVRTDDSSCPFYTTCL